MLRKIRTPKRNETRNSHMTTRGNQRNEEKKGAERKQETGTTPKNGNDEKRNKNKTQENRKHKMMK